MQYVVLYKPSDSALVCAYMWRPCCQIAALHSVLAGGLTSERYSGKRRLDRGSVGARV